MVSSVEQAQSGFTEAAQVDQLQVKRQVRRHDLEVEVGIDEVQRACSNHEDRQQVFRDRLNHAEHQSSELAHDAYPLYERFRPEIPAGKKGWGAKGDLDLALI